MPLQSRASQVRLQNNSDGLSARTLICTADVQDTPAGGSVSLTIFLQTTTNVLAPPAAPTSMSVSIFVDNLGGAAVRSYFWGANVISPQTFHFTVDGQAASAARAGLLRIRVRMANTAGLASTHYDVTSDSSQFGSPADSTPAGFGVDAPNTHMGYIRGTTTAVTTLNQDSHAYGDTISTTTVLGAPFYTTRAVTVKVGALAAITSALATNNHTTAQGVTDNRFPLAASSLATVTTFPNAALVSTPFTVATTMTEDNTALDPRLTFAHLHQDNDNVYGTPPMVKDKGAQVLASALPFLNGRVTRADGTGVNGISWTTTLRDANLLVDAITRPTTSETKGGEAGWGASFLVWDKDKPTGVWNKTNVITGPAGAVGLGTNAAKAYTLVAPDPNYRMLVAGGPATADTDSRHLTPGVPLLVGVAVFNTATNMTVELDSNPAPSVAIGRFNLALGRAEFLDSDMAWKAATGAAVYYWPCTVSPGDPNAWTALIADTSGFSVSDLFVVGKATIAGVPVSSFQKEIVVGGVNNHTGYAFDGAGFVGFPTR